MHETRTVNPYTPRPTLHAGVSADTESPRRPPKSSLTEYPSGSLREASAPVVVDDLGDIPLVPVDFFLKSVLPPVGKDILKPDLFNKSMLKRIGGSTFRMLRRPGA